jgi:hypothetical protein
MENWKDIAGYEGEYKISDLGNVMSVKSDLILKSTISTNGYPIVKLCKNSKSRTFTIHRLVLNAFNPTPLPSLIVNHKDGNKTNPALENLEWCTYSQNITHAYRTKLRSKAYKISVYGVEYYSVRYASRMTGLGVKIVRKIGTLITNKNAA